VDFFSKHLIFEPANMPRSAWKVLWVSASEGWHTR